MRPVASPSRSQRADSSAIVRRNPGPDALRRHVLRMQSVPHLVVVPNKRLEQRRNI